MQHKSHRFYLWSLFLIPLLFASCGAGTSGTSMNSSTSSGMSAAPAAMRSNSDQSQKLVVNSKNAPASTGGPQYLIKTLTVTMGVKDTSQVADALQAWISATDPHSTSQGINYQQADNNTYNITMSFSVQAALYPQIQRYLRDYPQQHKGQLLGFQETVQDVTSDYIDTQSRLKNLRSEQTRLLELMSHAQALGDIISVEQRLTDVEGQIEQIEEHLKDLSSQLQFYTITITLQPSGTAITPPPVPAWSVSQVFHDASAASLALAQGLLTLLIWLLAFSVYIVPLLVIAWFVQRWRKHILRFIPSSHPKV